MFARRYLERNRVVHLIHEPPDVQTGISLVIPCFREPDVLLSLQSLTRCQLPKQNTEVIVLINHSEVAPEETKSQNYQTKLEIDRWISDHSVGKLKFFAAGPVELRKKWAGAGLARKSGMDEAVRRFNLLQKPEGLIVSLDADTLVEENYLVEIENYFNTHPEQVGATIHFSHQTAGLNDKHLQGIRLYEKYMSYYKAALGYTGYPFPMFTVGSAFAVTAGAYVKRGGMNRRQAGEDFYFLQNLVQLGPVGEITATAVHPSARLSNRVPFGTGPILQKWMSGAEDLTQTYNFRAFSDLKQFFDVKDNLFKTSKKEYEHLLPALPQSVEAFLKADNFFLEMKELNANCAALSTFQNRFFQKFNAFKILKFLNFAHHGFYEKAHIDEQFLQLNNVSKSR